MRRLVTYLLLLTGCTGGERSIPLPDFSSASAILFITSGAQHEARATDMEDTYSPVDLLDDVENLRVELIQYQAPLSAYGLLPGIISEASSGRPLPSSSNPILRADLTDGTFGAWTEQDPSPELLAFRIPPLGKNRCTAYGGCVQLKETAEVCSLPCPEPAVIIEPAQPTPPDLPRLTPCPYNWIETGRTVRYCVPPEPLSCPIGQSQFVGSNGCETIGEDCPVGSWPEDLPINTIYVDPNAPSANGIGSRADPFQYVTHALNSASNNDTIAVAKGILDEHLTIDKSVTIIGACAAETQIRGSTNFPETVDIRAADVTLKNLSIRPTRVIDGIQVSMSDSVQLEGVLIEGAWRGVMTGSPVLLTAHELVVRHCGMLGFALEFGAHGHVTRSTFEDCGRMNFYVQHEANAVVDEVLSRAARVDGSNSHGHGFYLGQNSETVVTNSIAENCADLGFNVWSSTVTLENVISRNNGVLVNDSAFEGSKITILRDAFYSGQSHTQVSDLVAVNTPLFPGVRFRWEHSDATLNRVAIVGSVETGLSLEWTNDVKVSDLTVEDVGRAVHIFSSSLELNRARIVNNVDGVILEAEEETTTELIARDLETIGTRWSGIYIPVHADLEIERGRFLDNGTAARFTCSTVDICEDGPTAHLRDITMSHNQHGFVIDQGTATVERVSISDSRLEGLIVMESEINMDHARIVRSGASGLWIKGRNPLKPGYFASSVTLRRFELDQNSLAGILLGNYSSLQLSSGTVSNSPIGFKTIQEVMDEIQIDDTVVFRDNLYNVVLPLK